MTISSDFPDITNRHVAGNGIELNIAERGGGAPLIVMLHGFPSRGSLGDTSSHRCP